MGDFDASDMAKNLEVMFEDTYVQVEEDGDEVVVQCAELGPAKCRREIEKAFDDSGGVVDSLIDKFIGSDVVVYEDFDITEEDGELRLSAK